jgi:signal transduction histidine kinase/ligand-binding sensor domain-containing protein
MGVSTEMSGQAVGQRHCGETVTDETSRPDFLSRPHASVRKRIAALLLASSGLIASFAVGKDPPLSTVAWAQKNFTVEDGLPANEISSIIQTRNGFLWLATDGGLTRFDGQRFTPIHFRSGISKEIAARALLTAPDGALWVGTDNGVVRIPAPALDHFDATLVSTFHPGAGLSDQVVCLYLDRGGVLWVGTFEGLYRFDQGKFECIIAHDFISRIEQASNGHLLIITGNGFVEWDGSKIIAHPEVAQELHVATNQIFHVYEDRSGTTWYSSSAGVARRINGSIEPFLPYEMPNSGVWRVYEDPQGNVWVDGQMGLFRATAAGLEPQGLNVQPTFTYADAQGDLWLAHKGGLLRLSRPRIRMYGTADGLPGDVVMAVFSDHNGTLWAGNNCGGLSRFDGHRFRTYSEKDGLSNSCVWALAEDPAGNLWIGTWGGGLYRFRDEHFTQYSVSQGLPSPIVLSIAPARDGSLWIVTAAGLVRMLDNQFRRYSTADGLSSDRVQTVHEDRGGIIWVGTSTGVDRLQGQSFVALPSGAQREAIPYSAIREDSHGHLFCLSTVGGISRVEGDRLVSVYQGIEASGMTESAGRNLWFSTKGGIFRVPSASLKMVEQERDSPLDYKLFGRAEGLNSRECSGGQPNMAITPDAKLWVGTIKGLAMLDSSAPAQSRGNPSIFLEAVQVGRNTLTLKREMVLPPGSSHIELRFTAVELASPENIRLQYWLEGVDPGWLDADSTRRAVYTEIPPGTHLFHVRASNDEGVWDRAGVVYGIMQRPYFYQTILFRIASWAAAFLLIAGIYRFRLRQAAARLNLRLEERLNERTRIARDLHDTLLQSFQGILLFLQSGIHLLDEHPAEAKKTLKTAAEQAERAILEGREAVQGLRASTVDRNDLALAIKTLGGELEASAGNAHRPEFAVQVEGIPRNLHPILRDEVYRIAGEAMRNAFRHSDAKQIEVEIHYDEQRVRVRVRDDGKGIDAKLLSDGGRHGHFGLRGMRERARLIGGKLAVWSELDSGTEVELTIPASRAYTAPDEQRSWLAEKLAKLSGKETELKS